MNGIHGESSDAAPDRPQADTGWALSEDAVLQALRTVIDPEIGLDVVSLGLVYGLEIRGSAVTVTYSLTTPGCPLVEYITEGIRHAVGSLPGVRDVEAKLVWEPAWTPSMIQERPW